MEKIGKLRKSCNHKRNVNGIYNEKLHNNWLLQLPSLRLRILENSGERNEKLKLQPKPVFPLKIQFKNSY